MSQDKRSASKPRRYNPKREKICVGQYLIGLLGHMQKVLQEQDATQEEKNAASWAMNSIMFEVTTGWCRCPWCKSTSARVEKYYADQKEKKEEDEPKS